MASYFSSSGPWATDSQPHHIMPDGSPRYANHGGGGGLHVQQQKKHFRKLDNGKLLVPSKGGAPPQTTMMKTAPGQEQQHHYNNNNTDDGEWKGPMTVPRAVSQDEIDSPDKSISKGSSIDFSTSPSTIASAASVSTAPHQTPPQQDQESQQQQQEEEHQQGDASSVATSNFSSPLDRYRVDEGDVTAYYSAGDHRTPSLREEQAQKQQQQSDRNDNPLPLLETSQAIALSPESPFVDDNVLLNEGPAGEGQDQHNFVAEAHANLGLLGEDNHILPAPSDADSFSLTMHSEHNDGENDDGLRDLEALEQEFTRDLKGVLGDIEKITTDSNDATGPDSTHHNEQRDNTMGSSSLHLGSLQASTLESQSRLVFHINNSTAGGSSLPNALNLSASTQASREVPNQDIFVSKGTSSSNSPSVRSLPWSRATPPAGGITFLRSRSHDEVSAMAQTATSSQAAVIHYPTYHHDQQEETPKWRNTSILSPHESDESEKEETETERYEIEQDNSNTGVYGLAPNNLDLSGSFDVAKTLSRVDSQLQQSSPLPSLPEASEQLVDAQEPTSNAPEHSLGNHNASGSGGLPSSEKGSSQTAGQSEDSGGDYDASVTPKTTPQKSNRDMIRRDFSFPGALGGREKGSMLQSPNDRIQELEAQLDRARLVMQEQKEYYEEELAKFHEFTMPLQPHSPFDPINLKKYSPKTQQRKLLERNQTAVKEIRFAEVTCVELSHKNKVLEEELQTRDVTLETLRKEIDELKKGSRGSSNFTEELEKANADKLGLERQLHSAYDKMELMKSQHNADMETVRSTVASQKERIIGELRQQLQSTASAKDRQEKAMEMQRQELQEMASERSNLYAQVKELNEGRPRVVAYDRDDLNSKNLQLSKELQESKRDLQLAQDELDRVNSRASTLLEQVQELDPYKTKCDTMAHEIDELKDKLERLTEAREEALQESGKAKQLADDIDAANNVLLSTQVERDMLAERASTLSREVDETKQSLMLTQQQLNDASRERDQFRGDAEELSRDVQEAKFSLQISQQEVQNIAGERDDLRSEGQVLKAALEKAENALKDSQQHVSELTRERDSLRATNDNMSASVERAQDDLHRIQQESLVLARQRDSLSGQSQKLAGALEKAQHAVQQTQQELRDMARSQDALRNQAAASSSAAEVARLDLQRSQRDLRDVTRERDSLETQTKQLEAAIEQTNSVLAITQKKVEDVAHERDRLYQKSNQLSSALEEAKHSLQSKQEEAKANAHDLELLRNEISRSSWRLKEAERELVEVSEEKDRKSATVVELQQQVEEWKLQAEQKKLNAAPQATLMRIKEAEQKFWKDEAAFFVQIEKNVARIHAGLLSSGTKQRARQKSRSSINPALLSQILASSSSETLSPQVIQTLQVINAFVQQNLSRMDQKVAKIISEYAERLAKVQSTVEYIRSSIEFDSEDDDVDDDGSGTRETDTDILDATFAAVTSIPDPMVEKMEEARSVELEEAEEGGCQPPTKLDSIAESPARETILDLSKIEAVSPFYSSDLTFSIDSDKECKDDQASNGDGPEGPPEIQQEMCVNDVQRNVFQNTTEAETGEGDLLDAVSQLQHDVSQHQNKFRAFLESQQTSMKLLEEGPKSPKADRLAKLREERDALSLSLSQAKQSIELSKEKIQKYTHDLVASEQSRAALEVENDASRSRIASLQKEIADLEFRLVRNPSTSRTNSFSSRTNSFQERLEEASNEQSSSDVTSECQHLRAELADSARVERAQKMEIRRMQEEINETEKAHTRLKESFVRTNDRLAAAVELAEKHELVAAELDATKQKEKELRAEVKDLSQLIAGHESAKQALEARLQQAENERASLELKYQTASTTLEERKSEQRSLQENYESTLAEARQSEEEMARNLESAEEGRRAFELQAKGATDKISSLEGELRQHEEKQLTLQKRQDELLEEMAAVRKQKETGDEKIKKLEEGLRNADTSYQQLKLTYAACNNRLAEAMEQSSKVDTLESEKEKLIGQVDSVAQERDRLKLAFEKTTQARDSEARDKEKLMLETQAAKEELEEIRNQTNDRITSLEENLLEATASNERRLEEISGLEHELQAAQESNAELESAVSASNDTVATMEGQLSVAASKRQSDSKEIERLEHELQSCQAAHEKLTLTYVACNEKLASTSEQLEEIKAMAEREKETLEQRLAQTQVDANSKLEEMQQGLDSAERELANTRSYFENLVKESDLALQDSRNEMMALRSQVADVSKANEVAKSELGRLQDSLRSSKEGHEALQMKYIEANNRAAEKVAENEEIVTQLRLSRDLEQKLRQEKAAAVTERDETLRELESLKGMEANLRQENARVELELEGTTAELQALREAKELLQQEVQEATESQQSLGLEVASVQREKHALTNSLGEVKQALADTTKQLAASEEREIGLGNELSELRAKADGTETRLQEALALLENAQSHIAGLEAKEGALVGKLEAAEAAAAENREAAEALEQLSDEREAMRESIDATKQTLEEMAVEMGDELKDTQAKLLQSLQEGQRLCDELAQTKEQKDTLEAELNTVKQRLNEVSSELEVAQEDAQKTREELLENTLLNDSYEAEVDQLKQRLDEITDELGSDLKSSLFENQQLRDQLSQMTQQQASYENEIEVLKSNERGLQEGMEKLTLSYVECNEKLASAVEQNTQGAARMEELKTARAAADNLTKTTEGILQRCRNELQSTLEERDRVQLEVGSLREQLQSAREEVRDYQAASEQRDSLVEQMRAERDEAIQFAQRDQEQLKREQVELKSCLEDEKHHSNELLHRLNQARVELDAREAESEDRRMIDEKLKETEMTLLECSSKLADSEGDILSLQEQLDGKDNEVLKLKKKKDIWEDRCFKLREYLRKLVSKCEEWEQCHAQQSKLLEVLEERHRNTTERANQLARSYAQLNTEMKARSPRDSASSIGSVHDQIENELYTLHEEMKNVSWTSGMGAE